MVQGETFWNKSYPYFWGCIIWYLLQMLYLNIFTFNNYDAGTSGPLTSTGRVKYLQQDMMNTIKRITM
jgi:hypothetical protein